MKKLSVRLSGPPESDAELTFLGTMTHCSCIVLQIYIPPTGGELGEAGLEAKKKKKAKSTSAATLSLNGH